MKKSVEVSKLPLGQSDMNRMWQTLSKVLPPPAVTKFIIKVKVTVISYTLKLCITFYSPSSEVSSVGFFHPSILFSCPSVCLSITQGYTCLQRWQKFAQNCFSSHSLLKSYIVTVGGKPKPLIWSYRAPSSVSYLVAWHITGTLDILGVWHLVEYW